MDRGGLGDVVILAGARSDSAAVGGVLSSGFDDTWGGGAIDSLLSSLTTGMLVARSSDGTGPMVAACLFRVVADEAEILAISVVPGWRRQGIARRLIAACGSSAAAFGAVQLFLEVSVRNSPAIGLYQDAGFEEVGRRRGYYRVNGDLVDALIMRRFL